MALYVSAGKRFRRMLMIAAGVAIVAFVFGWLIGRQQVPSIDARVADVSEAAENTATGLERLDIEYEQVLDGSDDLDTSVLKPLDDLRGELQDTMDDAPWLTTTTRAAMLDALAQARQAAIDGVPLDDFTAAIDDAAGVVRATFGI
jgi:hypothetical protein